MRWKAVTEKDWHSHFAFWPVKIDGEWVWLERVLRKGYKRSSGKISPVKRGWNWDYVNSEFDLIKRAERERSLQESDAGQLMQAKSAAYNKSLSPGLAITGSMNAQAILQQIKSTTP
jgi:hypothetical protein